jgi:hypothetical protein
VFLILTNLGVDIVVQGREIGGLQGHRAFGFIYLLGTAQTSCTWPRKLKTRPSELSSTSQSHAPESGQEIIVVTDQSRKVTSGVVTPLGTPCPMGGTPPRVGR